MAVGEWGVGAGGASRRLLWLVIVGGKRCATAIVVSVEVQGYLGIIETMRLLQTYIPIVSPLHQVHSRYHRAWS